MILDGQPRFPLAEDENHARLRFRPRVLIFACLAERAEQQVQESRWLNVKSALITAIVILAEAFWTRATGGI